jgi:hypothetical protein
MCLHALNLSIYQQSVGVYDYKSNEDTLTGLMNAFSDAMLKRIENSLPCQVTEVSADRKTVTVKPLIRMIDRDGNAISRDVIAGIPVFTSGAGGFLISFPVAVGSLGWIDACDRDARFVPDIMTGYTISGEDSGAVVIQNLDGTIKIALDASEIRLTNGSVSLKLDSSKITGVSSGGIDLNGFIINADGSASSPVSVSAPSMSASSSLAVAGKEMNQHEHSDGTYKAGSTDVSGQSGPPV